MLFLFTFTFISCDKDDLTDKVETIKMYVSAETETYTPWGSETPVECMLVMSEDNPDILEPLAFGRIEGFTSSWRPVTTLWHGPALDRKRTH